MQPGTSRTAWRRSIALGDSFTEGLNDPDPARPGEYRGWADRLAGHLAAATDGEVEYANLAIRGRLVRQVLDEQVPVALAAEPDLVSLVAGGNDLQRPAGIPTCSRRLSTRRSAGCAPSVPTSCWPPGWTRARR